MIRPVMKKPPRFKWRPIPGYDLKAWLPTLSLSFAAFIFVTSEFMPVGLLPDIARGLGRSEAYTGLMVTAYAWVVALLSLPLTVLSARLERRKLMLALLGVFVTGNVLSGLAPNFWLLVAARVCVALAHSVFWAIATPLAARTAPYGKRGRALGLIITGTSLATILGVPLGTMLGHAMGWRLSFVAVAGVALLVMLAIWRLLPLLPSSNAGTLSSLPALLRRPALLKVYLLTVLTVTGHFTAYTYITPFLLDVGGLAAPSVVLLLLFLGGAGVPGSWLGGKYAEGSPFKTQAAGLAGVAACLALLALASASFQAMLLLCLAWGMGMTVTTLVYQTRVLNLAPDAVDVAMAIYSGIFNLGIGGGALLGSLVSGDSHLRDVGYVGAGVVLLALLMALAMLLRARREAGKST